MRDDPEFLRFYAATLLREARARRGTAFARTLLEWAGNARRRAMQGERQPDLFATIEREAA